MQGKRDLPDKNIEYGVKKEGAHLAKDFGAPSLKLDRAFLNLAG